VHSQPLYIIDVLKLHDPAALPQSKISCVYICYEAGWVPELFRFWWYRDKCSNAVTDWAIARFELFTATNFQVVVLWVVMPCSNVVEPFGVPCCLHLQGEEGWCRWYPTTSVHGVTSQKNTTWDKTAFASVIQMLRKFLLVRVQVHLYLLHIQEEIQYLC